MFGHFLLALAAFAADSASPVGVVRVEGLNHLDSGRISMEIAARDGAPCDSVCIREDLDRMERLGVFAEVQATRSGDTLVYRVKELPWFLPVPNGRVTQEEGLSLGAGLKVPDLFGQAIAGEFLFLAGSDFEWQASLSGSRVGSIPLKWDAITSRTQRWDDGRDFHEISYFSSFTTSGPSDQPLRLIGQASLARVHADRDGICLSADRADWIPSLRGGLVWDDRDRMGLTTRGIYQELTLEKAGRPLNGPVDAWEFLSDTRVWIPLGDRWGIHGSHLLERQWGTIGGWRTFVVGGVNTVRGLPGAWSVEPSEELATVELRWLALPVRSQDILGESIYWGVQAVAGVDMARTWNEAGWEADRGAGGVAGIDLIVPFVERIRVVGTWSRTSGAGFGFAAGLFEKSQAQRYRVR